MATDGANQGRAIEELLSKTEGMQMSVYENKGGNEIRDRNKILTLYGPNFTGFSMEMISSISSDEHKQFIHDLLLKKLPI